MKQFCKHYSSLPSPKHKLHRHPPPPEATQILNLCKNGCLSDAVKLLNSTDPFAITSLKPILYASLLQTCIKVASFGHGLQIHCYAIKSGLDTDRFVGNSLLSLYFKLGKDFAETRRVFDGLFVKDVVSWTSMVSGYVRVGKPRLSIDLFFEMLGSGVEPNAFTLSAVIKACSELQAARLGRCLHGAVLRGGFDSNSVISSALIDMYGRTRDSRDAHRVFDELLGPDAICWTSIISALTRNDLFEEALRTFYVMQRHCRLNPDGFTFGTVLTTCGNLVRLRQGKEVHAKVLTTGISGNVVVESSLVDMYGKCGSVYGALRVFNRMPEKSLVSWSALLVGYCQNGHFNSVIELFRVMEKGDLYSYGTALRACASLAAVRHGKEIHSQYLRRFDWRDVIVESALVDLYAKCGCINFAYRTFKDMVDRNLITWNAMVCGFAKNGRGRAALKLFGQMAEDGTMPDYVTFIGVLFACSHTGLVQEGREYFALMAEKFKIKPGLEHYNCMVDLLGRAGLIEEAEELIEKSDFKNNSSLWSVLLGACTTCTNPDTAERVAKKMMELEPGHHLSYVLLANVYGAIGRWNDMLKVRSLMDDRGVKKMPGRSWIETDGIVGLNYFMDNQNVPTKNKVFPSQSVNIIVKTDHCINPLLKAENSLAKQP